MSGHDKGGKEIHRVSSADAQHDDDSIHPRESNQFVGLFRLLFELPSELAFRL